MWTKRSQYTLQLAIIGEHWKAKMFVEDAKVQNSLRYLERLKEIVNSSSVKFNGDTTLASLLGRSCGF